MPDADPITTEERPELLSGESAREIGRLISDLRDMALVVERVGFDNVDSELCDDVHRAAIRALIERVDKLRVRWGEVY
jgi:hypothetical protein